MLIEVIEKYKVKIEENIQEINKNNQINEVIHALQNESEFESLDIEKLSELIEQTTYFEDKKIKKEHIVATLKYIRINNSYINFKAAFDEICEYLNKLIVEQELSLEECNLILNNINELLNSLENTNSYIENIDFIVDILKKENVDIEKIYIIFKEIDEHNKNVNIEKEKDVLEVKEEFEEVSDLEQLFFKYPKFTQLEKELLTVFYNENKEEFINKVNFITSNENLEFIFSSDINYNRLFVVLLTLSNIDIMTEVIKICKERNFNISKLQPSIFCNIDSSYDFKELGIDETRVNNFYFNLTGSYEDFIDNLKYIPIGFDYRFQESVPSFFTTYHEILKENVNLFNQYHIPISKVEKLRVLTEASNLEEKINLFIQFGLFDYINEYPTILLNKDNALFYRIFYAQKNGLTIKKGKYLSSQITDMNGYGINEDNYFEKVDNYNCPYFQTYYYNQIRDDEEEYEILYNKWIEALDFFTDKNNTNFYNIAGIIIPKIKVKKLYFKFYNQENGRKNYWLGILFSLVEGLIIDKETFDRIVIEVLEFYEYEDRFKLPTEVKDSILQKLDVENNTKKEGMNL